MSIEAPHFQYGAWRERRIARIIEHYGPWFFRDKTLVELACGYGDIGRVFESLGAKVTYAEPRQEHLAVIKDRYPAAHTVEWDAEKDWTLGQFDVCFHMGLLYHVDKWEENLRAAAQNCHHMVLETEVMDSIDPLACKKIDEAGPDQSIHGKGSRPSPANVERVLRDVGMRFCICNDHRLDSGSHRYSWTHQLDDSTNQGARRFWFCTK